MIKTPRRHYFILDDDYLFLKIMNESRSDLVEIFIEPTFILIFLELQDFLGSIINFM